MPIFNPWVILGAVLALFISFGTGYEAGHKGGVNAQKIADQAGIDKVNAQIAENKRIAYAELANSQQEVIATQVERDKFKTQLEQEHQTNVETTNKLRDAYSAYGLRFRAEVERSGASSQDGVPSEGHAASDASAPVCQLSDATTKSLRDIAYDCDTLRDDYKLLYDWAHTGQ